MQLQRYRRRSEKLVIAVQLRLQTDGLAYMKWGATQRCKADDFIVDNGGEVYTIDRAVFERTYRQVGPGCYVKYTPVWAAQMQASGAVITKEGITHYAAGDFLVANDYSGDDCYAITRERFDELYELDDAPP